MNDRENQIKDLKSKLKELEAQETQFWDEVKNRLPEIKERFSLIDSPLKASSKDVYFGLPKEPVHIPLVMKDPKLEKVPAPAITSPKGDDADYGELQKVILENYIPFGGKMRQREIASLMCVDQSTVSNQYVALKQTLFDKDGNIADVSQVCKKTGLPKETVIDKAFIYLAGRGRVHKEKPAKLISVTVDPEDYDVLRDEEPAAPVKPAWFKDVPFDTKDIYRWLSSVDSWWKSRIYVIHQILGMHKMSLTTANEKTILNKIYRLIDDDFSISLDDKKALLGVKNAINVCKSDPVVRVYFDAELDAILRSGKFVPLPSDRKKNVDLAKEYVKTIDPAYIEEVDKMAKRWVSEIILRSTTVS